MTHPVHVYLAKFKYQEFLDGVQHPFIEDGRIDTGVEMNGISSNLKQNSRKSNNMSFDDLDKFIGDTYVPVMLGAVLVVSLVALLRMVH